MGEEKEKRRSSEIFGKLGFCFGRRRGAHVWRQLWLRWYQPQEGTQQHMHFNTPSASNTARESWQSRAKSEVSEVDGDRCREQQKNGFVRARTGDLLGVSEARYQLRHETT
ncbi:hypothetical protein LIA77_08144 [Sarocladium implicatum]|nr:hypothetical protein LIA77_08144 [Sarocladium implicatum]